MARIRICGGKWRSRLIDVSAVAGLRPTPDRVRETLFNWLGQDLTGLSCLDLFAGSGVLGFEAASRGARRVTLVERDAKAYATLRRNAEGFDGDQLELQRADALEFLASLAKAAGPGAAEQKLSRHGKVYYDLVFLDPPYHQGWLARLEPLLAAVVAPGARLYVEAESAMMAMGVWRSTRHGKAGQVYYHLMERA